MATLATTTPCRLHAKVGGLHLISKLRCDAALYFPYIYPGGEYREHGPKVAYDHLPMEYLKETSVEGTLRPACTRCSCATRSSCQPLNVVIIAKTNLRTQARAHVVLFNPDLAWD